jgi:hypothetical protein
MSSVLNIKRFLSLARAHYPPIIHGKMRALISFIDERAGGEAIKLQITGTLFRERVWPRLAEGVSDE